VESSKEKSAGLHARTSKNHGPKLLHDGYSYPMEKTIHYRSSRKEVSEWYWKMWRKKFWRYHIATLGIVFLVSIGHWPPSSSEVLRGLTIGLIAVIGMLAFPQIMFKPQERTLTTNDQGIHTKIGNRQKQIGWNEISEVEKTQYAILIVRKRTGNAFIIPQRAFKSEQEFEAFYQSAKDRQWEAQVGPLGKPSA